MPVSHAVGPITVTALEDGSGPFFQPRAAAFAGATAEQWQRADAYDPAAVTADGDWLLRFRCFAVRRGDGPVVLVDAGIGPAGAPAATWAPVPGRLPNELAAAGIDRADVAAVVLTHLHTDHIGWAVVDGPFFPNARYLLQRAERGALDAINPGLREVLVDPLAAAGQLHLVDGDAPVAAGVRVVATPGHTPGHQSVLVEADGGLTVVTGDLFVHALQLLHPELPYAHEMDPQTARASRESLLVEATARRATLATAHLSRPFLPAPHPS